MKRVLIFTSISDTKIQARHFEIPKITEPEITKGHLELKEIGPRFDLTFRRSNPASIDLYKTACRKPKVLNPEKKRVIINYCF